MVLLNLGARVATLSSEARGFLERPCWVTVLGPHYPPPISVLPSMAPKAVLAALSMFEIIKDSRCLVDVWLAHFE